MGQFVSALAKSLPEIINDVANLIQHSTTAIAQLQGITQGFSDDEHVNRAMLLGGGEATAIFLKSRPIVSLASFDAAEDSQSALKAALTACKSATAQKLKTVYPDVAPPANAPDGGFITGYNVNGDLGTAVEQINNDLQIWNIPVLGNVVQSMAKTIQIQVKSTQASHGTSAGRTYINRNQSVCWAVGYGEFAVDNDQNGLVYGFTAALDSGW